MYESRLPFRVMGVIKIFWGKRRREARALIVNTWYLGDLALKDWQDQGSHILGCVAGMSHSFSNSFESHLVLSKLISSASCFVVP